MRLLLPVLLLSATAVLASSADPATPDLAVYAGHWTGQARMWQGPAKPVSVSFDLEIAPDGAVAGHIGTAECLDGHLLPRQWWQIRSFNHYEMRIDCALHGELTSGVVRRKGTVALNPSRTRDTNELSGWFFSEGHDGFPLLARPTQARVSGLILRREPNPARSEAPAR